MANLGDLELRTEPSLAKAEPKPSRRDEPAQIKPALAVVSYSLNIGQKSPAEPATIPRRKLWFWLWPWAWLAVTGVATLGWLIGIGWAAVELVHWLAD
jgi:hypothetical protein